MLLLLSLWLFPTNTLSSHVNAHQQRQAAATITASGSTTLNSGPLIGYIPIQGTYSPTYCESDSVWSTVSAFGKCCSTGYSSCPMTTACASTSLFVQDGRTSLCLGDAYSCFGDVIYKDINDKTPVTLFGCDNPRAPYTAYRATFGDPGGATKASSATNVATSSTSSKTGSSGREGWLVGVIVGPIAAIIIGGLSFWIYTLKKNKGKKSPLTPPIIPTGRPSTSDEKLVVAAEFGDKLDPISGTSLHSAYSELPAQHGGMKYTYELQEIDSSRPLVELPESR